MTFESTNLEQTEHFLINSYAPMRIGSSTDDIRASVDRIGEPGVTIDQNEFAFEMSYDVDALGKICLCSIESGAIADHQVDGWRDAESFGPGQLLSFTPPDRSFRGRIHNARYSFTMVDPSLLARFADADRRIELLDHHPISANAAAQLQRTITHLRSVLAEPEMGGSPLVRASAIDYLVARVLETFPNNAADGDAPTPVAAPPAVRRAKAYIDENAGSPVSVGEIAAASSLTVRALQYAFRRHVGMTPMNYLRQTRLDRARAELTAADPYGPDSVTSVALRWSFLSPSRFAALYREAFGETPSQTLRS
ncbi:helix-turn-helix transcriptional regulator [Microlunatus sp. Gsoil 973]|uniref:helix-turn-helix transcriptional regulator n=1 Tax=Microlunatus sp. Gsoil 973 TaxID=2672569 RepID=UPI001E30BA57|nr:helix-turn-helix transcriptional regulator [Microlunatus sp. Gsoil 973]